MNTHIDTNVAPVEAVDNQLIHLLHRAGQVGDEVFLKSFRDFGLTPRQYAVLTAAQHRSEPSQAALVADTGIDRSTLADIVGRLVEKGLVERHRTERDARAYAIVVTAKGTETIAALSPKLATVEHEMLAKLPAEARETFTHNLRTIIDHLAGL